MMACGRFDPQATPSVNVRCLRIPAEDPRRFGSDSAIWNAYTATQENKGLSRRPRWNGYSFQPAPLAMAFFVVEPSRMNGV